MQHHADNVVGATVGGTLCVIKSLMTNSTLTWMAIIDAAVLAAIGAMVGFVVTSPLKWIRKKISQL